jgi:tetratricopeptide (TPR) repeat protein
MAWDPQRDPLSLSPMASGVPIERIVGDADGLDWLRRQHLSVMRMIPIAVDLGFDTHAWQLAWTMSDFLNRQGYWHDLATAVEQGLVAARRGGDRLAEARMQRLLGRTYALLERLDDSNTQLEAALRLWIAADDQAGRAHTYIDLSRNAGARKHYSRGAELARRAAECYAAAGNAAGEANALNAVGWYLSLGGAHEQALAVCEQALLRNRAAGDRSGEAATLDSIGAAHLQLGNLQSAEANLVAAAALFAETGDPGEQAGSLGRLAAVHVEAARQALRQAVGLFEGIGARSAAQEARNALDRLG